jgi:hypothetical protein
MFNKLLRALGAGDKSEPKEAERPTSAPIPAGQVILGPSAETMPDALKINRAGTVMGKPWRLETGRPTRDFILTAELRAKAELNLPDDAVVVLLNRKLKDALEKQAFSMYTDDLQTTVDPQLGEEMRWLSLYEEVGWEGPTPEFWQRYAVLSPSRETAMAWLDSSLAQVWMNWPDAATTDEVPMSFAVMRGKAYLRMEFSPAEKRTADYASLVFEHSCLRALNSLGGDLVF